MSTVEVMVVDDQPAFRRVAHALIDATAGFEAVGDAASGPEALRCADQLAPNLVLMDVHMPGMDGFEAARLLTQAHPDCVVVLVSLEDLRGLDDALAASGATAFVQKHKLGPATLRGLWAAHAANR